MHEFNIALYCLASLGAWTLLRPLKGIVERRFQRAVLKAIREHRDYVNHKLAPLVAKLQYDVEALKREQKNG